MRKPALLLLCLVFCCCKSEAAQRFYPNRRQGGGLATGGLVRGSGKVTEGNDNPPSLFPVRVDGKYGYIDKKGKLVLKADFVGGSRFSEGLAGVNFVKGGRVGFIDETGTMVIPTQFDLADPFSEGYSAVMKNRKWGYIDRTGQLVIPMEFDAAEFFAGGAAGVGKVETTTATTFFYINRNGEPLFDPKQYNFESILPFGEGLAAVRRFGQYFSFIDQSGKTVIPPQFIAAAVFADGLAPVNLHVAEGMRWGFIGKDGKLAIRATSCRHWRSAKAWPRCN